MQSLGPHLHPYIGSLALVKLCQGRELLLARSPIGACVAQVTLAYLKVPWLTFATWVRFLERTPIYLVVCRIFVGRKCE